jgi:hypothetical protein
LPVDEFFARLKEHKTVQWTLGYVAVSFALSPVLDIIASRFDWSQRKSGYAPEQLAKIQFTVTLPGAATQQP